MPATDTTFADLFGADSKVSRVGEDHLVDVQEFAFNGLDSIFVTSLGGRGRMLPIEGILRTSAQATTAAAGDAMKTLIDNIRTKFLAGTLMNLFAAESTRIADLYTGTATSLTNVCIVQFREIGRREFSGIAPSIICLQGFQMTLRRLE